MVSADAGTVTVQYTRHSHHHRIKSSIPPDQLGPPYPSLTILYQVHHVSLGCISCSGMRLILGGIKKSLVMVLGGGGTSIAGPRQPRLSERSFYFIAHRTRDLLGTRARGLSWYTTRYITRAWLFFYCCCCCCCC